ncbi:MAG: DMP19 family protein [Chitinophagaceae bacterium]|nr:DMP19 family protein [Chitinophagaceae bacterium]
MSFFKKLFGGNGKKQDDNKPDINALLSSPDTNNALIEIYDYISKLGDTLDPLTEPQKNFYYNQELEREINNGGFSQFFYNSSGDFAHETLTSLRAIGATKTANILQQAIDQFPDSIVPKERLHRQNILEQIHDKAGEIWDQLDEKFYKYEDNLYDLNWGYIKQNRSSF